MLCLTHTIWSRRINSTSNRRTVQKHNVFFCFLSFCSIYQPRSVFKSIPWGKQNSKQIQTIGRPKIMCHSSVKICWDFELSVHCKNSPFPHKKGKKTSMTQITVQVNWPQLLMTDRETDERKQRMDTENLKPLHDQLIFQSLLYDVHGSAS